MNKKISTGVGLGIIALLLIVAGGVYLALFHEVNNENDLFFGTKDGQVTYDRSQTPSQLETENPTKDWQIYNSANHPFNYYPDFSFKYPPSHLVEESYETGIGYDDGPHKGLEINQLNAGLLNFHLDIDNEFWVGHFVPLENEVTETLQLGKLTVKKVTGFEPQSDIWSAWYSFFYNGHNFSTVGVEVGEKEKLLEQIITTLE